MEKQVLREIYKKYGEPVITEPRRLRAFLLDMRLPKKSVNLLVDMSKTDYFRQFVRDIVTDEGAREKLIYAAENEYAFDQNAIRFGADCWVYAFTGGSAGDYDDYDNFDGFSGTSDEAESEIWTDEKAELVAAALRELLK